MGFGKKKEQEAAGGQEPVREKLGWKGYLLYYLGYTVVFCVMAACIFIWLFLKRRRLVWHTDGVNQHYYGLLYFSRWGKEVLQHFRETGTWQIPTFSLRMGYGGDLFTTLAYYVIGDPFSLPAVFVPEKYLLLYHDLMLLARFWLAGITFSAYNFYMGRRHRIGVLVGAMIYIFNGFTLSGMRHHYFLNPFVFFPLLLIGCEWYFRKKKPWLFLVMVFVTAVSNFYFFYMMVIMTVLYAVWRSVRLHGLRHFGGVILDGIAFVWYGLIGTLLSSFIFLPIILRFLQDPRTTDTGNIPLVWSLSHYRNFIDCFLTNGTRALSDSWTYMGFGAVALLCVAFIFVLRRKHFDLKAAFVVLTALLLTPAAGYVLNGFSYPANRWMWAYALLIGTMAAAAVPELAEAGGKQLLAGLVLFVLVIAVCVGWGYTFSRVSAQSVILGMLGMAAVLLGRVALLEKEREELLNGAEYARVQSPERETAGPADQAASAEAEAGMKKAEADGKQTEFIGKQAEDGAGKTAAGRNGTETGRYRRKISVRVQAALLVCAMLSIASEAYFAFSPDKSAKVSEYLSRAQIETSMAKDAKAASELIDRNLLSAEADENGKVPFYRYTTYNPENNTSLLYGVSNTQYYWSLSDPSVSQFLNETGQLNQMIHLYDTLDDRTFLNEIAGIRYFLGSEEEGLPYGYEKKKGLSYSNEDLWPDNKDLERYSCEIFENTYALPFGFTSDKWISREDYDAMDIPERQQALMQGILLEEDPGEGFSQLRPAAAKETANAEAADAAKAAGNAEDAEAAKAAKAAEGEKDQEAASEADTSENSLVFTDVNVPVQLEYAGDTVSVKSGKKTAFQVDEEGGTVTVRFEGMKDCETGLYIRGLKYTPPEGGQAMTRMDIPVKGYAGEVNVTSKQLGLATADDPWTTGRKDFYVNMRYHTEALDHIDILFSQKGTYSFDSIEVVCQPMTGYAGQAEALRASSLTDLDIHEMGDSYATGKINGHIELTSPQILCLQIPCTAGWTAYVDGKRAELLQADTMFSGLLLSAGSHEIELHYQTPGLRLGAAISAATLVFFLLFMLIYTIVSAILHRRDKRLAAIPVAEYEPAVTARPAAGSSEEEKAGAESSVIAQSTAGEAVAESAEAAQSTAEKAGAKSAVIAQSTAEKAWTESAEAVQGAAEKAGAESAEAVQSTAE